MLTRAFITVRINKRKKSQSQSLLICMSGGVAEGVSTSSCSGSTIWWSEQRDSWLQQQEEEVVVLEVELE